LEIPLALPDYGRMTGDAEVIEYFRIADNTVRIVGPSHCRVVA
jgi:hypothetical protein